jgi:hypothetical protein
MGFAITVKSKNSKKRIYVALIGSFQKNGTSFFETKKGAEDFIDENNLFHTSLKAKVVNFPESCHA